ncbi:hypothetical protein C8R43DRAFT_948177 [Mycena crocata]|nr:hypothetical protein C8R43DRAFT_948177 [Mycena crocata]
MLPLTYLPLLFVLNTVRATVLPPYLTGVIVSAATNSATRVGDDSHSTEGLVLCNPHSEAEGAIFVSNSTTARPFRPHPRSAVTTSWSIYYAPDPLRGTEAYTLYCNPTGNSTRLAIGRQNQTAGALVSLKVGLNNLEPTAGEVRTFIVKAAVFRTTSPPGPPIPVIYYTFCTLENLCWTRGTNGFVVLAPLLPGLESTQLFAIVIYPIYTDPFFRVAILFNGRCCENVLRHTGEHNAIRLIVTILAIAMRHFVGDLLSRNVLKNIELHSPIDKIGLRSAPAQLGTCQSENGRATIPTAGSYSLKLDPYSTTRNASATLRFWLAMKAMAAQNRSQDNF